MRTVLFLFLAALLPAQAFAANQVALDNNVFVERVTVDAQGKQRILLEEPKVVVPGDRLVFVLNYRNAGGQPADKFGHHQPAADRPSPLPTPAIPGRSSRSMAAAVGDNWQNLRSGKPTAPAVRRSRPTSPTSAGRSKSRFRPAEPAS